MKKTRLILIAAVFLLAGLLINTIFLSATSLATNTPDTLNSTDSHFRPNGLATAGDGWRQAGNLASTNQLPGAPGRIYGYLYQPDGVTPVDDGWINVYFDDGEPWGGTNSAPDGYFSLPDVPPGDYKLVAYPPDVSPFAPSTPEPVTLLSGTAVSKTLLLTQVRISGHVEDGDTFVPIAGAPVVAHNADWSVEQWDTTNITGEFKIGGVNIGETYTVEVLPPPGSAYVQVSPVPVVPITTNVVLQVTIPPANVVGFVQDPGGAVITGTEVTLYNDFYWDSAPVDASGGFLFRGVPVGAYWLEAYPPWGSQGLLPSPPRPITITQPTDLVDVGLITLPGAPKTVSGQVVVQPLASNSVANVDASNAADALVWAIRLDEAGYNETYVDASGAFTVSLTGGDWILGVDPLDWDVVFAGPPTPLSFALDATAETEVVTLEVIATDAKVTGRVVCPGGAPCTGAGAGDPPPDAFWVDLGDETIINGAPLDATYVFTIPIPHGWYELAVFVDDPWLQEPGRIPVHVGPGQVLDVGDIELLPKDAIIQGQVFNESGVGVAGVGVSGWQANGALWGWAETDATGAYTMPVVNGEWSVTAEPEPDSPYVFNQKPELVFVGPGETITGVNFVLTTVDATILGTAVDATTNEVIWGLDGWAWADRAVAPGEYEFFSEAPLRDGLFELKVQGGAAEYYISLSLPPFAPYIPTENIGPIQVNPGDTVTITVPLAPKDAAISGQLRHGITGAPVTGIRAEVFGEDEQGNWVTADVDPGSGMYDLGVISGTWHLRAWVDPDSGFIAQAREVVVTVSSGETAVQDFRVWPANATISGRVLAPDGAPLSGAFVFANGNSLFAGHFETHTESDANGYFQLQVPRGIYDVGAALPGDELAALGWLNPPLIEGLIVTPLNPATGLELRFNQADGLIQGTISFTPTASVTPTHPAFVWAWAETGEWAEAEAIFGSGTATYTLPVVGDTVWRVGAVYEDRDSGVYYESDEATVPVPPGSQVTQDLVLDGPWSLPQPFIVSFDAAQMQTIILPDGVTLDIPPGALASSGTVTLYIFPTRALQPEAGQEIVGLGYNFWATDATGQEIAQFNQDILVTFSYEPDAVLAQKGIAEEDLAPAFFSTLLGHWVLADGFVVDTVNNEITFQTDHFTRFGTLSKTGMQQIYLPTVIKN